MAAEKETVMKIYAAINRNDIPAVMDFFDPQAERIEPAGFPSAGTYRGHAAILAHISAGRNTWAEGVCEPERLIDAGDKPVAAAALAAVQPELARGVARGVMHKNTASRKFARLTKAVSALA